MQIVSETSTNQRAQPVNPLDGFYLLKTKDENAAHGLIKQIIIRQPHNVQALKEAGYLAVRQGHRSEAINYFTTAIGAVAGGFLVVSFGFQSIFIMMGLLCFVSAGYIYHLSRRVL